MEKEVDFKRVEEAIRYLSTHVKQQPSLYEVAEQAHLSPFHFQKLFSEWAGISPKKFLQYLTVEELKKELHKTANLAEAAELMGLSSTSRVYDLFVQAEAVTPHEFKTKGKGIDIYHGVHPTPFGDCFIAVTERGICSLQFANDNEIELLNDLRNNWQQAVLIPDQQRTLPLIKNIFTDKAKQNIKLLLKGTPFQLKVWEALLKIPFASLATYQTIAGLVESPKATRAVGSAVGANPIAYLIPCHRVIRREAIIGQYRWGTERKKAMIGWEKAKSDIDNLGYH